MSWLNERGLNNQTHGDYMSKGMPEDQDYICTCGEWRSDCNGLYMECSSEED